MSSNTPILELCNVDVDVAGKTVLKDLSLRVMPGETHVLLGPNGSGKSSLLAAIMGLPPWTVTAGSILVDGADIRDLDVRARAEAGIGMAFQRPPSLDGVTVKAFAESLGAEAHLAEAAEKLDLKDFISREMNVGFSGGEIKRWEVLKLVLQDPRLMLFDEPESGVDLEHVRAIGQAIREMVSSPDRQGRPRAGLVITHTGLILSHVDAACAHILNEGRLVHSGDPATLFTHIQTHGYTVPQVA
ncbi:MAG: ABC transporter ATP-binding protein [Gammaproteobacteria bacterium]|nr:MAG: ABC transporter ATP-binding protein [Gammaproteobacteria bacterium]PIE37704.1 MAG: ABC transporter ATP-binding protein [Gammaproteobacteria bacterium]